MPPNKSFIILLPTLIYIAFLLYIQVMDNKKADYVY